MGKIKQFTPVKLICGLIFSEEVARKKAQDMLLEKFGQADLQSDFFPFNYSHYYEQEMGRNLKRYFLSFQSLIGPEQLPALKHQTNQIEKDLKLFFPALNLSRPVNLDPGYLKASALIMATTKDFAHRIPLTDGIYAHLELLLTKEKVRTLTWTYPDFYQPGYQQFFLEVRKIYLNQLRRLRSAQSV
ncbi:MAG TPA: DUF4416 family protein [Candidatus Saccharicenans sp.]|nr:DUF4416 family protein [Candidatus Saccharicenans sp.]HUM79011.1 DUF4416 family protein [Candidatus Saccharicenans sp.]